MHAVLIQELKKHVSLTAADEEVITKSFRYKKVRRNQYLVQPPDVALWDIAPANRALPPRSVFIPREKMPTTADNGVVVKVVMGSAGDVVNDIVTPEAVSLLDIRLGAGGTALGENEAIAFGAAGSDETMRFLAATDSRLLLISGPPMGA